MRILAVADNESDYFYEYYTPGKLDEYDLILSCGDLRPEYLEFLVTMARCPLLYVHGNHDTYYIKKEPEGCVSVEDRIYEYNGVRILGLGGSIRYRPNADFQYTQRQMERRVWRLGHQIQRHKGFDILLTHSPAYHINDLDTPSHTGFQAFVGLLDKHRPKYFIHGHVHLSYDYHLPRLDRYGGTTIINASGHYAFEYDTILR